MPRIITSASLRTALGIGLLSGSGLLLVEGSASADTVTTTFASTGAEQTFTVPPGVTKLHVVAIGGRGGRARSDNPGGKAAKVTADIPVVPGETLFVEVGSNGVPGGGPSFNGGGGKGLSEIHGEGGSGGGASDIRTAPMSATFSFASRLVVAGGGGGGGGYGGGGGGNAETKGENGAASAIGGGGGATIGSPGAAGAGAFGGDSGGAGTFGIGGNGGDGIASGGGGGGGYYGGGGGGAGRATPPEGGSGTGAGGGGGSSYVEPHGIANIELDTSGVPSIVVSYETAELEASPSSVTFAATQATGTTSAPIAVTLTNGGTAPLSITSLVFSGVHANDFFIGSSTCLADVAPSATCSISVRFVPGGEGARTATLQIGSTAGSPTVVPLSGTGGPLPQGAAGPAGSNGAAGATGATGSAGSTGATGPTGAAGPAGADGLPGAAGADGGCSTSPARGGSTALAVSAAIAIAIRRRRRR